MNSQISHRAAEYLGMVSENDPDRALVALKAIDLAEVKAQLARRSLIFSSNADHHVFFLKMESDFGSWCVDLIIYQDRVVIDSIFLEVEIVTSERRYGPPVSGVYFPRHGAPRA